jgi:hypothetical protein
MLTLFVLHVTSSLQGKSPEQGGISGHRDVIFVLSNDESGTRGLVLNRPSDCVIGDLTDLMGSVCHCCIRLALSDTELYEPVHSP